MRNFSPSTANGGPTDLLERPQFGVLPTPGTSDGVAGHLSPGGSVAVSASPTEGVLVPSGDALESRAYPDAVALLQVIDAMDTPSRSVGITAYREFHPAIADELTIQYMWGKRRFAAQIVSNLTFDANVVDLWLTRVRVRGTARPLSLGVLGHVNAARLLAVAARVGVGDSARFLLKQPRSVARLVTPRGLNAVRYLRRLAPALTRDEAVVAGPHGFAFNQFAATEARRVRLIERLREGGARTRSAPRG